MVFSGNAATWVSSVGQEHHRTETRGVPRPSINPHLGSTRIERQPPKTEQQPYSLNFTIGNNSWSRPYGVFLLTIVKFLEPSDWTSNSVHCHVKKPYHWTGAFLTRPWVECTAIDDGIRSESIMKTTLTCILLAACV